MILEQLALICIMSRSAVSSSVKLRPKQGSPRNDTSSVSWRVLLTLLPRNYKNCLREKSEVLAAMIFIRG
jgi:hypothetical protein